MQLQHPPKLSMSLLLNPNRYKQAMLSQAPFSQFGKLAHYCCQWASYSGYRRFRWATKHMQQAQYQRLSRIISSTHKATAGNYFKLHRGMSIEQFQQQVPITDYQHWQAFIEKPRAQHQPL